MLLIVLAIAALNAGIIWSYSSPNQLPRPIFRGALVVPLIQSVVFLAVGFTISFLMGRLRKQQDSLESANVRLTHYSSTLEQLATTRERSRLARELHDTLAHTLSGLAVQLETVKAYWDVDREMSRLSLEKSIATAHSGLEETRRALKALRATSLDDMGLAKAVETMVTTAASRGNLKLDLSIAEAIPGLSPDVEQSVYRIAQEAITNVVNHADAKHLVVRMDFAGGKLLMSIIDDGKGFDVEKAHRSSQFGLTGMKERAQIIGGDFSIKSEPGKGTTVQLTV
jgi:signal transduction histidine kinase